MREDGKLKGRTEWSPGRNQKGFGKSLRWERFHGAERTAEHRQKESAFLREDGDLLREYQAMHEEDILSSWLREDVEGKEERERMNKGATEEESKRGKRERWREKGKGLRLTVKVSNLSESFVPFLRWSVWGTPWIFLCAHASLLGVSVVTVLLSDVNVDCEVVFSYSDCGFVEPQTLPTNGKHVPETGPRRKVHFSKQHQKECEAEHRFCQKERLCSRLRRGLVHRVIRQHR